MSQTPAVVRTSTPPAYGAALIYLAKRFFDVELSVEDVLVALPIVSAVVYMLARALETLNPKFGYILGVAKQPAYSDQPSPSPDTGEDVEAVVVPDEGAVDLGTAVVVCVLVLLVLLILGVLPR